MQNTKLQIALAVIGLLGVLGAAAIGILPSIINSASNGAAIPNGPGGERVPSRTCSYTGGPKKGVTEYFSPSVTVRPVFVGDSCIDGHGSYGVAVRDR